MAFADKYQAEFTSYDTYDYRITVQEDGFVGSVTDLILHTLDHTEIDWTPSGVDEFFALAPSTATVQIYDASGTIEADINSQAEGTFRLHIEQDTGGGYGTYWIGHIPPDGQEVKINETQQITTITAFCGLGSLNGSVYEDAVTPSSGNTRTVTDTIIDILNVIGHGLQYRIGTDRYPFAEIGSGGDSLNIVEIQDDRFREYTSGNDDYPANALSFVLEQLAHPFLLQIYQSGGYWRAIDRYLLDSAQNGGSNSYTDYRYNTSKVLQASGLIDPRVTAPSAENLHIDAQATRGRVVAYNRASVVYDFRQDALTLDAGSFEGVWASGTTHATGWTIQGSNKTRLVNVSPDGLWGQWIAADANATSAPYADASSAFAASTKEIDQTGATLIGGSGTGHLIRVQFDARQWYYQMPSNVQWVFHDDNQRTGDVYVFLEVKVGSQWLQSDGSWSGSQAVLSLRCAAGAVFSRIEPITSDEIPATGSLYVAMYSPVLINTGTLRYYNENRQQVPGTVEPGAVFDNLIIEYLPGGEENLDSLTTTGTSGISGLTGVRPTEALALGDGPATVFSSSFLDSSAEITQDWQHGTTNSGASGVSLHGLMLTDMIKMRGDKGEVLDATFRASADMVPIEYWNVLVYNSKYYGAMGLTRKLRSGLSVLKGWTEISINATAVTITQNEPTTNQVGGANSAGQVGGGGGGGSSSLNVTFIALTTTSADISTGSQTSMSVTSMGGSGKVRIYNGDTVVLVHLITGQKKTLTASADFDDNDTTISFSSSTFNVEYPSGSAVYIEQETVMDNAARSAAGTGLTYASGVLDFDPSGLTEVTAVDGDFCVGSDDSDSGAPKRFEIGNGGSGAIALANGTVCSDLNADKVDGYDAGNDSGQVAVSNGTKCTNLNADKLDGKDSADFAAYNTESASAPGASVGSITVDINGSSFEIPYIAKT